MPKDKKAKSGKNTAVDGDAAEATRTPDERHLDVFANLGLVTEPGTEIPAALSEALGDIAETDAKRKELLLAFTNRGGDLEPGEQAMLDALGSGLSAPEDNADTAAITAKVAKAATSKIERELRDEDKYAYVAPDASRLPRDADQLLTDILVHRGWDRRLGQVQMVEIINNSILESTSPWDVIDIAVNAPVGTGKTLAYLVACIAHRMRVVISTSTKGLQDQIMQEELPKLAEDLKALYGFDLTFGMLKGKSNYSCLSSVNAILSGQNSSEDNDLFSGFDLVPDGSETKVLKEIATRARVAQDTGNSLEFDSEHLLARLSRETASHVRASKRCAGKSLPWMDKPDDAEENALGEVELEPGAYADVPCRVAAESECIYRAAYAHNMASQVVVMNTTLLVYEIMRANAPMGGAMKPSLLRGVGMVIVDEAHHLFSIISQAYSVELDFGQLKRESAEIAKRLNKRYSGEDTKDGKKSKAGAKFNDIMKLVEHTEAECDDILDERYSETREREELKEELNRLIGGVSRFINTTTLHAITEERRNPSGNKLTGAGVPKPVAGMMYQLSEAIETVGNIATKLIQGKREEGKKRVDHYNSLTIKSDENDPDLVMTTVPIDVSFFREELTQAMRQVQPYAVKEDPEDQRSVVTLSSGTITKITPIVVGMREPAYLDVESPFDPSRVRMFVPAELPKPNHAAWLPESWSIMKEAIVTAGGRTLILTTSLKNKDEFTERAEKDLGKKGYTVFSQGNGMSKLQLVEALKTTTKAVLIGTKTFWEGVDIPGDALIQVIIDKMMFPMQDDPAFEARRKFAERRGENAFKVVDVDFAAVMLAQGTGRLIRSVKDHGGIMVLDHRMLTAGYSSSLTKLLPADWMVTRDEDAYLDFMEWANPDTRKGDEMPPARGYDDNDLPLWNPLRRRTKGRGKIGSAA